MASEEVPERRTLSAMKRTRAKLIKMRAQRRREIHASTAALTDTERQVDVIEAEIALAENEGMDVAVSEHAIYRYQERILKIDMGQFAEEILALPKGHLVMVGSAVVTVLSEEQIKEKR